VPRPNRFPPGAHQAASEARIARAASRAADIAPIIAELQAAGVTSLNGIAAALNARGVQTPRGRSRWYASQVARVLKRLAG
jgi:Recombinase